MSSTTPGDTGPESSESPELDTSHPAVPPLSPLPLGRWLWQLGRDVFDEYRKDGVGDMAASIAFWTLLSIPAAILALVSALSSVRTVVNTSAAEDLEGQIQDYIDDTFAESDALSNAVSELFSGSNAGVVTVATLVALFSLSRGFAGLIRALDRAYEIDEGRKWWHLRLVSLGLGIGTIVVVAGSSVLLALLPQLPGGTTFTTLAPVGIVSLIVLWAATLFHIGPYHRTPWRYDMPGAILTTIGWVASTQGFALYIRITDQSNQVQTTIGAVLLGFTLMYLLSIVMLLGAELNDVISRRAGVVQQPVRIRERIEAIKERMADDAPEDGADDPTVPL